MSVELLRGRLKYLRRLEKKLNADHTLALIQADETAVFQLGGLVADDWQKTMVQSTASKVLCLAGRQCGKSQTAAALALNAVLRKDNALVLLTSPTARQSNELFLKIMSLFNAIGRPIAAAKGQDSATRLRLSNGSRIISLPGTEGTIRGFSAVDLLIIDEASRVEDSLFFSVKPMTAVSGGRIVALSTPWGRRGFFHECWTNGVDWERVQIRADQCPRISADFLAKERAEMGDPFYRQEYECSFESCVGQMIAEEFIQAALSDAPPLFPDWNK